VVQVEQAHRHQLQVLQLAIVVVEAVEEMVLLPVAVPAVAELEERAEAQGQAA